MAEQQQGNNRVHGKRGHKKDSYDPECAEIFLACQRTLLPEVPEGNHPSMALVI